MESLHDIKNRIKGIASTKQITKSMRMISTTKVQRVRNSLEMNRPFLQEAGRMSQIIKANLPYGKHFFSDKREIKNTAVIVIGGDRGLCGGYNVSVGKEAQTLIERVGEAKIITVGVKARDFCKSKFADQIVFSYRGISESPFFEDAETIAETVVKWYKSGEVDQVYVVYTQFQSMLSQIPQTVKLLPFEPNQIVGYNDSDEDSAKNNLRIRCEIACGKLFEEFVPFHIAAFIYSAILESSTSEQSARIASMDAAVRNADEMIEAKTLIYNQARQSAITQELIEIVNGAEALM